MTVDHHLALAVREWVFADPDPETRRVAESLLASAEIGDIRAERELRECFRSRIPFGTSGLRAPLGPGPARMNRVVVAQTSVGFARFLLERAKEGKTSEVPSVVVGFDARRNSKIFALDAAEYLAGAGINVTLLPGPSPTPLTAFAVRHLSVSAGVMITASHNPPLDNGYKVYLGDEDGGRQIAPPTDRTISAHIDAVSQLPLASLPRSHSVAQASHDITDAYIAAASRAFARSEQLMSQVKSGNALKKQPTIVYTALHGVGGDLTARLFAACGMPELITVGAQQQPDETFCTVDYPNPEEDDSLTLAFDLARQVNADAVIAHDPDADRLALAVPDPETTEGWRRLTGNQLGLLLGWRAAQREVARAAADGTQVRGSLANTIVSSPALGAVAAHYGLTHIETLSGFKWVSRVPNLLFGYEEALGYLTHPEVLGDKDGMLASLDAVAMVHDCTAAGITIWQLLDQASELFGHYASRQIVIRFETHDQVRDLSDRIRATPPVSIAETPVSSREDLLTGGAMPVAANVLTYHLADGSRVMVRPSGTEPKLKVYLDSFANSGSAAERRAQAERALSAIEADMRSYINALIGEE